MEERIVTLLRQAGFTTYTPLMKEMLWNFAYLVAEDCIDIIEKHRDKQLFEIHQSTSTKALLNCQEEIRNTFGARE